MFTTPSPDTRDENRPLLGPLSGAVSGTGAFSKTTEDVARVEGIVSGRLSEARRVRKECDNRLPLFIRKRRLYDRPIARITCKDSTEGGFTDSAQSRAATIANGRRRQSTSNRSDEKQSKKLARDSEKKTATDVDKEDVSMDRDEDDDNNNFSTVKRKHHQQRTVNKAPSNRTQLTVYVKGISANIAKEATRKPHDFKKEITDLCGQVDFMEARNNCVRIVCQTTEQRDHLLNLQFIVGKEVSTTKPWSLTKDRQTTTLVSVWKKGIITRSANQLYSVMDSMEHGKENEWQAIQPYCNVTR